MLRACCVRVCFPRREAGVCCGPRCSALRWRLRVLCVGGGGGAPTLAVARGRDSIPRRKALVALPASRAPPPPPSARTHRALGLTSSAAFLLLQGILPQQGILLQQGIPHMAGHPASGRASHTRQGIL